MGARVTVWEQTRRGLAKEIVGAFESIRSYLRQIGPQMESVDPMLSNNVGLVRRLVDWEEGWELGSRYILNDSVLSTVATLSATLQATQEALPDVRTMVDDHDAELFVVLPRLVLLSILANPEEHQEFFNDLLASKQGNREHAMRLTDMNALIAKFHGIKQLLQMDDPGIISAWPGHDSLGSDLAWAALVKCAVAGPGHIQLQGASVSAISAVDKFLLDLERWSMELQRACPTDWNHCAAVLIRCSIGAIPKDRNRDAFII